MGDPKETKDVIVFVDALAKQISEAKADGKLDGTDAVKAVLILPKSWSAIADAHKIPQEIASLSGEELEAIVGQLANSFANLLEAITSSK